MIIFFLLSLVRLWHHDTRYDQCESCKKRAIDIINGDGGTDEPGQMLKMCNGSLRCIGAMDKLKPFLVSHMKQSGASVVCSELGKCKKSILPLSTKENEPAPELQEETESNCDYCKNMIDYFTGEALQETMVPIVMKLVRVMCANLPPASVICKHIADNHVEKLIMLITSKFENSELCSVGGFCE